MNNKSLWTKRQNTCTWVFQTGDDKQGNLKISQTHLIRLPSKFDLEVFINTMKILC